MHARRAIVILTAVLALPIACGHVTQPIPTPSTSVFAEWSDQFIRRWLKDAPQVATRTQYLSDTEQDPLDRQLSLIGEWGNPYGVAAAANRQTLAERALDELQGIPRTGLTATEEISGELLEWFLDSYLRSARFARHAFVFEQLGGLQLEFVNHLTQTHPVRNRRDVENYLARLALVGARLDDGIEEARQAAAAGFIPPRFILQRTVEQIDAFLRSARADNPYYATLVARLSSMSDPLPEEEKKARLAEAQETIAERVVPAYRRVRDLLVGQIPASNDDAGVWRLPDGAAFYTEMLRQYTTTDMSADEIHALGLREVARIETEMDGVLRELGYDSGSINARYAALEAAEQPKGSSDPRPVILADTEKWVRDAERRAADLFDARPKARVEVRREPAFSEQSASAHYTDPSADGTRPGIYWLPLPGAPYELLSMRSTAYHEVVPGHHFQIALQLEMTDLPRFRRLGVVGAGSAYVEGWALYAERLADEHGWYEGDPKGRLGYLAMQLLRARRLVVDTGLHVKRWTRQQAIDYGMTAQEVERYIVLPGQACAYMVGQLRIVELRERARAALGARFSIRAFHNAVLRTGDVPLNVLSRRIDEWIRTVKG